MEEMMLSSFLRMINALSEKPAIIIGFAIWPLFFVVVFEVIARRVFGSPTDWAMVMSKFIFGGYLLIGGGYCIVHGAHATMDLVHNKFSPRGQAILDLVTSVVAFLYCIFLLWGGVQVCWDATLRNECVSEAWRAPRWPYMWMLPLATFLLLLQTLAKFIRDLRKAIKGAQ
jgi:TRAP-type C4-dicarboxylate transport system permease small subunit